MTSKSEGFCPTATHIWISPRVVGPCYSEDMSKGLLSGSKGRKYDTSGQMLKPQGEKGEEGSTSSQTARFLVQVFWESPREPLQSYCTSVTQEHPLPSAMFLPPKKGTCFSLWLYSSCPFPISTGDFVQSFFKWSEQGDFHQFLGFSDPLLDYNQCRKELPRVLPTFPLINAILLLLGIP